MTFAILFDGTALVLPAQFSGIIFGVLIAWCMWRSPWARKR